MMQMILAFDRAVMQWITQTLHSPLGDVFFPFVTRLGNGGAIWLAAGIVLLCIRRTRRTGVALLLAVLAGWIVGDLVLKPWVARLRPFQAEELGPLLITPPSGWSFPSGHTLSSFAAATVLASRGRRWAVPAFVLAGCIAFSRIYLCVHYPTDVLTGMVLGAGIGAAAAWGIPRLLQCRDRAQ